MCGPFPVGAFDALDRRPARTVGASARVGVEALSRAVARDEEASPCLPFRAYTFPGDERGLFQLYRSDGLPFVRVPISGDSQWQVPALSIERIERALHNQSCRWIDTSNLKEFASEFFDKMSDNDLAHLTEQMREHRLLLIPLRPVTGCEPSSRWSSRSCVC